MVPLRRRLLDIPGLLRTPAGRSQIRGGFLHHSWPVLSRLAGLHRRTFARRTRIATVVGSFGKSTTLRTVLAALGDGARRPTLGNHRETLAEGMLRLRPRDREAVIEVGIDRRGLMVRLARMIRPDVAVVTTIGSEHNRSLGTLEMTRAEKAEMVKSLAPSGLAVLNGDDPHVRWMAGQTRAKIVTYGLGDENEVRASDVQLDWPHGTSFQLHADGVTRRIRTRMIGRHMVYPMLAAVAVALAWGRKLDDVTPRLEHIEPAPGRMEIKRLENGAILVCDYYKSALETIDAALDVLAQIPAKRRIVVMGEVSEPPGSQGPIYRRLGERIARIASRAVFVGHNFQRYRAGATRGGLPADALVDVGDFVLKAAEALEDDLGPGDVVLIKGRDTQRLDRIACVLEGRTVGCDIPSCGVKSWVCHRCPMLERGWDNNPAVV